MQWQLRQRQRQCRMPAQQACRHALLAACPTALGAVPLLPQPQPQAASGGGQEALLPQQPSPLEQQQRQLESLAQMVALR